MDRDVKALIAEMTLEEKAGLCSGADHWRTKAVERLGIPALRMSDGPHGLRKQTVGGDHLGLKQSLPATCFLPAVTAACSWDRGLVRRLAEAIGVECLAEGVDILLGPGVNLKRSPLCGRNFEYFSEDPYLTAELARSYVDGLQSQGVGASLKHFAANNQEEARNLVDSVVDDRTLRELYLAAFETAVAEADPATVMCAYNLLNGTYCSENRRLLTDILKTEWGHGGFVVSDWGAVNERVDGLEAGLELEMPPGHFEGDRKIVAAVESGRLPAAVLDAAVERILKVVFRLAAARAPATSFSPDDHHALARASLRECVVLLKNEGGILPLKNEGSIAVVGAFAAKPRFQGGGSSFVTPYKVEDALEELRRLAGTAAAVSYAPGYRMDPPGARYCDNPFTSAGDQPDEALIREAVAAASAAGVAVVFAGLPESYETEGGDRPDLRIPEGHRALIEAVAAVQPNTVVVLSNGAPIEMPWLGSVKAVLEGYLGGQASGGAVADILFGAANPCGKLAETFPAKLSDTPTYLGVPGKTRTVEYREGLFIGYRHYEAKGIEPLFPFGFGLSYTAFSYEKMALDRTSMTDRETLTVSVTVRNVGGRAGKEIVQLYVSDRESSVVRPSKELKGFAKVALEPGEAKTVDIELGKRAFAHWSAAEKRWCVESGPFDILVGPSSAEIALRAAVEVRRLDEASRRYTRNSTIAECLEHPRGPELMREIAEAAKARFMLKEGTARMESTFAGLPVRYALSFLGSFAEEDLQELLKRLNG